MGCVEFEQPPDALDAATAAALEFWDGTAWARVHAFDALSGGSRLTLTAAWERPADSQRYRLVNTEVASLCPARARVTAGRLELHALPPLVRHEMPRISCGTLDAAWGTLIATAPVGLRALFSDIHPL